MMKLNDDEIEDIAEQRETQYEVAYVTARLATARAGWWAVDFIGATPSLKAVAACLAAALEGAGIPRPEVKE